MEPGARFAEVVTAGTDVALDVGALCIAAHAHPGLEIDEWLGRLDELAGACTAPTFGALRSMLFDTRGYRGDQERYEDPENSFLDSVIARRRGIPISLSVLVIEVARRLSVSVLPIGMPGHFLVREADCPDKWCDPFHGGRLLDRHDCKALFDSVYRGTRVFDDALLQPTPRHQVLARMLSNLEHGELAADPAQLAWMCELHLAIPRVHVTERLQLLRRYARVVDPIRAAQAYERASEDVEPEIAEQLRGEARLMRSRMN